MAEWIVYIPDREPGHDPANVPGEITGALVRCRECRHYMPPLSGYTKGECLAKAGYFPVDTDWFCADGERKEQPENVNRCVCCGEIIPEGRQVCPDCSR